MTEPAAGFEQRPLRCMLRRVGVQGVNENVVSTRPGSTGIVVDVAAVKRAYAAEMPERQFTIAPGNVGS